ncbi:unnamed protein product [Mucor hiemalis]
MMKDELDCSRLEEKEVYGLLVEGFKCQLFVMDLSFHKVYRLYMIKQFYFPHNLYDLHALVPCFRSLDSLERIMARTTDKILDSFSLLLPTEENSISHEQQLASSGSSRRNN